MQHGEIIFYREAPLFGLNQGGSRSRERREVGRRGPARRVDGAYGEGDVPGRAAVVVLEKGTACELEVNFTPLCSCTTDEAVMLSGVVVGR